MLRWIGMSGAASRYQSPGHRVSSVQSSGNGFWVHRAPSRVLKLNRSGNIAAELCVVHSTCAAVYSFASIERGLSVQQ